MMKCPHCDGTGNGEIIRYDSIEKCHYVAGYSQFGCEECNGTGEVEDDDDAF